MFQSNRMGAAKDGTVLCIKIATYNSDCICDCMYAPQRRVCTKYGHAEMRIHSHRVDPRAPGSQTLHLYIWFAVLRLHPAVGNLCHISSTCGCESRKAWLLFCCEGRGFSVVTIPQSPILDFLSILHTSFVQTNRVLTIMRGYQSCHASLLTH